MIKSKTHADIVDFKKSAIAMLVFLGKKSRHFIHLTKAFIISSTTFYCLSKAPDFAKWGDKDAISVLEG